MARDLRRAYVLAGLVILLILPGGCGRAQQSNLTTQDGYAVTMVVEPSPPAVGPAAITATLKDPAGRPVDGARLDIEANMSHAGMVPVLASTTERRDGLYRVPLTWTMAGDWYVDVVFTLPDGSRVARRYPVGVK